MPEYLQRRGQLDVEEQRRSVLRTLRMWGSQIYTLLWLRLLSRTRRPFALAADFLVPLSVLFVVWFGANMSPFVASPAYFYNESEVRNIISPIPTLMQMPPPESQYYNQTAGSVYTSLYQASDFYDDLSDDTAFTKAFLPAITSADASRLSSLLFSDSALAAPLQIPSFDGYIKLMNLAREHVARQGLKDAAHISGFIWQIMNRPFGKITFSPNTPRVDLIVRHLLTTSTSFTNYLVPRSSSSMQTGEGFGFASEADANGAVPKADDSHVWAHITIHSTDAPSATSVNLEYTIAMNETDVPQPINHMNQFGGIGASFSQYYFSGFLTLQHEIQEAITMAAQQVATLSNIYNPINVFPEGRLDPLALAMSTCNQALNDTFPNMNPIFLGQIHYPTPTESDQMAVVDGLVNTMASPWITSPVPVMQYASNLPCLYEAYASCRHEYFAFDMDPTNETSATLTTCIRSVSYPSNACRNAIDFITKLSGHCFANAKSRCGNMTEAAFLTGTQRGPAGATGAFQTCMLNGIDPDCDALKFGQMVRFQTQYSDLCATEIGMWCQNSHNQFECLRRKWATNPTSNFPTLLCETTIVDATKCVDDIKALCFANWDLDSPMAEFPFACLHLNVNLLSQSCFDSDLIQQYTEVLLGRNATISTPTRAQQTCRVANTLNTAIRTGITAVSFPSDGADANSFFRNCGPLIGLVIALSFMYPFTTLTRHIAEERERGQKTYLLLAGANHSSILMSHLLSGLATMFILSLLSSIPIEIFAKYTPTHIVFGLTFSYCFSLVGLSMFIAACVNTSRTATIVAPIILFATTIPAFIIFGDFDGLDILFTPSTAAESFNILVALSNSPHIPIYAATVLFDNGGIMFGMGLVYIVAAMLIEYIRISTYSFGCLGRLVGVVRGHLNGSQKIVFKNFKNSKMYHSLNRSDFTGSRSHVQAADQLDDQDTDELSTNNHFRDAQDLEADLAEEQLALEERRLTGSMPNPHRTPRTAYSIGGVGESGASTNDSDSNNFEQTRSESGGVKKFVQLKNASVVQTGLHGAHTLLRNVTCTFFKNRANVIVGPSASGKSSILDIIGGRIAPTAGTVDIDDSKGSAYNRTDIGVALQSNIYWDVLSVKEHIEFIQNMKGVFDYETKTKELRILSETLELDLENRAELIHLSTGLQRRLAVAMAFAGGGRLILLDEPTASVDPVGRRCIWKLIHQNTEDRCIIIATSQAEEAEKADHLVLLHRGELKATGAPRFVKEVLGGATILSLSRGAHCQPSQLLTVVSTYCPHSKLINNVGQEICFRIDPADFHSIPLVLTELEVEMGKNSVKGISIADSRFDELFMKVIREFDAKGKTIPGSDGKPILDTDDFSSPNTPTTTGDRYAFLSEDTTPSSTSGAAGTSGSVPRPGATASTAVNMSGGGRGGQGGGGRGRHRGAAVQSEHPMEVDTLLFRQADAIGTIDEYNGRLRGHKLHFRNLLTMWSRYVAGSSYRFIVSILTFVIPLFAVAVALNIMNIGHARPSPISLSPSRLYMYNSVPFTYNTLSLPFTPRALNYNWKMNPSTGTNDDVTFLTTMGSSGAVDTSHYLKDTAFSHGDRNRYGAIVFNSTYLTLDNGGSRIPIYNDFLMHNTSSPHAMPSMHTLMGMVRMQQRTNIPNVRILASSAPFLSGVTSSTVSVDIIHTLGAVLILVPFTFLPAILVGRIIKERHSGHLDMISASYLSRSTVWVGAFVWQFFYLMLFSVLALCLIVFSDQDLVVGGVEVIGMFFLMAFYCGCALSSSYVFALPFKNHVTAQNVVTMFHFTAGFTFVIAVNAVDMLPVSPDTEAAKRAAGRSANVLRVFFPSFAFGDALVRVTRSKANRFLPAEIGMDESTGGLKEMGYHPGMHDVGVAIACLALTGMAYFAFLLIYDDFFLIAIKQAYNTIKNDAFQLLYNNLWRQCANRTYNTFLWDTTDLAEQEPSVAAERAKVADYGLDEGVVLDNVWQRYIGHGNRHAVYAVQRANLIIAEGDRIAVVGNNGSGKTSLLDMIAARVNPAHGRLRYWNANRRQCADMGDVFNFYARSYTGYAGGEQESGLPDDLTPYFLMNIVADARGLKLPLEREAHIAHLLHTLGILQVGLTRCGYLSPIIKRRVTIAMALVGFPPVVILDEPTSCMDPVGRRQIWAAINLLPTRCALVVSTQHHEDVEMLSNRVVLMDHGSMRLIASTKDNNIVSSVDSPFLDALPATNSSRAQQARRRVISLTVTMNMPRPSSHSEEEDFTAKNEVVEHVFNTFPGATVTEDREGRELKFQLNAVEVRRDDHLEGSKVKKWGAPEGDATTEEAHEVSDERAAVIAARAGPPGVSVRDVFEKMHQKRTEMMIMGIKGAPLSGRPSPTSREEPPTSVVGDSTTSSSTAARGKFPLPPTSTPKMGTRSDPDLPDGDAYPFEMKVSCSAHQQLLSDSLIPLKPGQIGNNNEVQVVERRIENMSCKVPIRDAPTLY